MSCQQIVMSLLFFQFMANLEQSGSRIPDAWSVKVAFLLTAIFYFKNWKTELENLKCSSPTIAFSKGTIIDKKCWFLQKNADISKI